ncbi:hypothetical protein [Thiomonas sp. FB-6]|uniref:hypothetical protein n=1 Tax=Thiomonas sp. FB-6 TaxID=1158291 RepID=UPI00038260FF|nr:hypothetical protein [Thiomonas sp. FB-6]
MRRLDFITVSAFCGIFCLGVHVMTFVLLRLVTVRRLLRDPRTRYRLGLDIFPGWQTWNVASTLSWSRAAGRYFDSRPLAMFRAHSQTVYAHTRLLDRCLARLCYGSQILFVVLVAVAAMHDRFA